MPVPSLAPMALSGCALLSRLSPGVIGSSGCIIVLEDCVIKRSMQLDGICISGVGTRAIVRSCQVTVWPATSLCRDCSAAHRNTADLVQVHGHKEVGVMVYDQGDVEITNSKVWDCDAKHGVYAKGTDTKAVVSHCEVFECGISCIVAGDGARVKVRPRGVRDLMAFFSRLSRPHPPSTPTMVARSSIQRCGALAPATVSRHKGLTP